MGGGSGSGSGGGKVIVIPGPDSAPSDSQPHRVHIHPQAKRWRIKKGKGNLDRIEIRDDGYHVYFKRRPTFNNVKVQWQDGSGRWRDH
mgnify:FL=1